MPSYSITEPHPTALPNHYIHTGRGGAGNMIKSSMLTKSTPKSSSLHKVPSSHSSHNSSAKTSTGRGGAGNIHLVSELPMFSFDEEMNAQVGREKHHDVWHVGRGGAGNWTSRQPEGSSRKVSGESNSSSGSGLFGRLSGAFERR